MKKIVYIFSSFLIIFVLLLTGCTNQENDVEKFQIHTELQEEFLKDDYRNVILYAKGKEELSKPLPVTLNWQLDVSNDVYVFHLSESKDFKDENTLEVKTNSIEIYNLKIQTTYYWYVSDLNNLETKTEVKAFIIESETPRNLAIDGLTNVRDVGGYKIGNNKRTNQGLIYRSSRLNENETTDLLITQTGIKEMLSTLKIKSELDIRQVADNENGGITESPLGTTVNYYSVPMKSGGNCILLNKDVLKDAFAILGNANNYPIVIHCSIGTDRTGMLAFLINALLGVSEEDLYRVYLFSNFGDIGRSRNASIIKDYLTILNKEAGNNLAEKAYNYLLSLEVEKNDLDTLINIMTK